jgi:hypothetical protein
MIRWLKQLLCARRGHPYRTMVVPIVGRRPGDPETDKCFCTNCGAELYTQFTDNAGTETVYVSRPTQNTSTDRDTP